MLALVNLPEPAMDTLLILSGFLAADSLLPAMQGKGAALPVSSDECACTWRQYRTTLVRLAWISDPAMDTVAPLPHSTQSSVDQAGQRQPPCS